MYVNINSVLNLKGKNSVYKYMFVCKALKVAMFETKWRHVILLWTNCFFLLAAKPKSIILFYAHNPADGNPSRGDTFVFQNVLTNFGNGYDNKTGVFTAPMSGVYVFTLQVCVNDGKSIYYEIKQGKESILKGRQYKSSSRMCTAAVAFSYLKTGDSVSSGCSNVDTTTGSNIAESPTYYHSSFSGLLVN